jgi:hypothetical protein
MRVPEKISAQHDNYRDFIIVAPLPIFFQIILAALFYYIDPARRYRDKSAE